MRGDFIPYQTYGIRLLPTMQDNGGILIMLSSIVMGVLIFRPPAFVDKPANWSIVLGAFLVPDCVSQAGRVLIARMSSGQVGAPMIQIGLVMTCGGSMLLLATAVLYKLKLLQ